MNKERIFELLLITLVTLLVLTLSSCAISQQNCAAYASLEME